MDKNVPERVIQLSRYVPGFLQEIKEIQEIYTAEEKEIQEIYSEMDKLWTESLMQEASAWGIKRFEKIAGLNPEPNDTLEYRRQRVFQTYCAVAPFSEEFLRDELTKLFEEDYTMEIDFQNSILKVFIFSSKYGAVDLFDRLVQNIVPANMEVITNHWIENDIACGNYVSGIVSNTLIQTI